MDDSRVGSSDELARETVTTMIEPKRDHVFEVPAYDDGDLTGAPIDVGLTEGPAVTEAAIRDAVAEALRVSVDQLPVCSPKRCTSSQLGSPRTDSTRSRPPGKRASSASISQLGCCRFCGHEDRIVTMEPESGYDGTEVRPRVQDRGREAGDGAGRVGRPSLSGFWNWQKAFCAVGCGNRWQRLLRPVPGTGRRELIWPRVQRWGRRSPGSGRSATSSGQVSRARHWFERNGERFFRAGGDMTFAFVARHRRIWPVSWLCEVTEVSRSGFRAWLHRPASARAILDAKLVTAMTRASGPATGPMAPVASGATCSRTDLPAGCTGSNGPLPGSCCA